MSWKSVAVLLTIALVLSALGTPSVDAKKPPKATPTPVPDTTPPDAVTNLEVNSAATTHQSITLTWTATGDDGSVGQATSYDVRYALDGPMTEAKWDTEPLNQVPVLVDPNAFPSEGNTMSPAPSGSPESVEIAGLAEDTTYHFGVKACDEAGNCSVLAVADGETTIAAGPGEWAIDIVNQTCWGPCGGQKGVDVNTDGRIGTMFNNEEYISYSYRDPGSTWEHELLPGGSTCRSFAYTPSGAPSATKCKDGNVQWMYADGDSWTTETVFDGEAGGLEAGSSLAFNPITGEPGIAFRTRSDTGVSQMYAWRSGGTWTIEEVDEALSGPGHKLAFHPTEGYPSIAYAAMWDDVYRIHFAERSGGSWTTELVYQSSPPPRYAPPGLAYHPIEHYPAIVYPGYYNEGIHYRYRTESGWTDPQIIDAVDRQQTGGVAYEYRNTALAFGSDGMAYAAYRGKGYYDVFRVAASDGTGWQNVHHEAPMSAKGNPIAVNRVTGQPVLAYGLVPPKIIERIPPNPGVTVAPTTGLVTTEAGNGTDTFAVRLDTEPTANVTIDLFSSDTSEGTVSPASLTFTPTNWHTVQSVTVTGVDDSVFDGDQTYTVIAADTESTPGSDYDGLHVDDVSVTNLDDDAPLMHVGDLEGTAINLGGQWQAEVTITVHDADHDPVVDATVSGSWSAGASGTAECTTDGSGVCTVTSPAVKKNKSTITFAVDNVTHASLTYDAADNHDPDGDSDGTTISVNKP